MRVRNAILAALLAAAGIAVFADDAQAIGRRKKKAAASCCPAPAVAPQPCCGGGAVPLTVVGSVDPTGNVIVSSDAIPAPMPRDTTSAVTGTGSNAFAIPSKNVIPVTYAGANPGMVVPAGYAVPVAPARRGLFRR